MKRFISVMTIIGLFVALPACKSKDDDDDDSSSDDLVLMNSLTIDCGGEACFGDASSSLRVASGDSALQTMRMFAWISLGFPSDDAYVATLGEDASDELKALVPTEGFVGNIEAIRETVVAGAQLAYPSLATCADAPTSGDFDIGSNTATWQKASMKAPSSFPSSRAGDTYDKAVSYTSEDGTIETQFEFFCDYNGMASVMTVNDDDGDLAARYAFFYDRDDDDQLYVDFYLLDDSGTVSSGALELGVQLRSLEEGKMQTWVSRTGTDPDRGIQGYRYAVNANVEDETISFFILNEDEGYTAAQWDALTHIGSTAVTGGEAIWGGAGSVDVLKNGCASGWDAPNEELLTATLCDDLDLEEAPANALDADGDASLTWVKENLRDLIEAL